MDPKISELIHSCSTSSGISAATYSTLYGSIKTKFNIPISKYGNFMDEYCRLAYEDASEDMGDGIPVKNLCIGEVVEGKTLPLMGNFRFKFHVEEGQEDRSYFGEDLPLRIIKCYQQAITDLLMVSPKLTEYICCVQQGHSYRKGDCVIINLLFQFPFCQLDINFTKTTFKPYIVKLLRQNKIINAFDVQPIGDWNEILVDNYEIIPLYRSTSEVGIPHNSLDHIYGYIEEEHIEDSYAPEINLEDVFNIGTFSFLYNGKIPIDSIGQMPKEHEDKEEFLKYWLPLFLSIHYWSGQTTPKESALPKMNESTNNSNKGGPYQVNEADSDNPKIMVHSLLPLLSHERANKDYSWLDVGRSLFNIFGGEEEGLNLWIGFSSRATQLGRDKGACIMKYPEFRDNNFLSIKTIAWYAKLDNEAGYSDWHLSWCNRSLNEALTGHHSDVAKAIYRVYWLEYIYSSDTRIWYQYRNQHYYKVGPEIFPLRRQIVEHFVNIFERMRSDLSRSVSDNRENDDTTRRSFEVKIKETTELIRKLKNENYKSTVLKTTKDFFQVEEFERLCDKNIYLTALSNCVLEVVDKKVRPRPGKPEDYVLKFSTIVYPFDYNWDSYWVKEVMHWFKQITVGDNELRHYFLKRLSSFLRGLNPEKLFDVWTNEGNGGKSMLTKTLQHIFGSYFIDFPVSLLTGGTGKNSGGPNPELAQANNARGAILAEPDDRETMKGGMIKRLTGGDRLFTRELHSNGGSMELTFKTILVCNRIPDIANVDKALIRRFVIMPFLGTWCDDAPEDDESQFRMRKFKIDPFFESKIPDLAKGLLWIIVQYYKYYAEEGLKFPKIVDEYIEKHWQDNDWYLLFIAEKIIYAYKDNDKKEIDTDASLSASEIYQSFQRWFKDYYPGMNVPSLAQMKADLSMAGRLGPQTKRAQWCGIKIKQAIPELGANLGKGMVNL